MREHDLDAYATLGVEPSATQAELKAAHRRLVRRHHPDLVAAGERDEATARVQRINVAYGLVRDPEVRARYDRLRARRRRPLADTADRAALAAAWEALVADAGRWAGRWWSRRRRWLRRSAASAVLVAQRSTTATLGRLQQLLLAVGGAGLGFGIALGVGGLLGAPSSLGEAVGIIGGWALGWSRGRRRRLRRGGLPRPPGPGWVGPALAATALALAFVAEHVLW